MKKRKTIPVQTIIDYMAHERIIELKVNAEQAENNKKPIVFPRREGRIEACADLLRKAGYTDEEIKEFEYNKIK
jgi:hypothetical protein